MLAVHFYLTKDAQLVRSYVQFRLQFKNKKCSIRSQDNELGNQQCDALEYLLRLHVNIFGILRD